MNEWVIPGNFTLTTIYIWFYIIRHDGSNNPRTESYIKSPINVLEVEIVTALITQGEFWGMDTCSLQLDLIDDRRKAPGS